MVTQLAEALHYRAEGGGFLSHWYLWNFSLTLSFWLHFVHGVDTAI
jgi:hypothetical protein